MTAYIAFGNRQRGWVGLVVLLIALVIVAFLAKDALKQYGALSGASAERKSSAPADADASIAPAEPPTPVERARGLEETLKRQADEQAKKMP